MLPPRDIPLALADAEPLAEAAPVAAAPLLASVVGAAFISGVRVEARRRLSLSALRAVSPDSFVSGTGRPGVAACIDCTLSASGAVVPPVARPSLAFDDDEFIPLELEPAVAPAGAAVPGPVFVLLRIRLSRSRLLVVSPDSLRWLTVRPGAVPCFAESGVVVCWAAATAGIPAAAIIAATVH
jgi:hypothetical protein